ncbi:uracil DNA glycosylase [Savitreella phatthalungensis]
MSTKRTAETIAGPAKKLKAVAITSFFKKDSTISSSSVRRTVEDQSTSKPFDKALWVSGLSERHRELLKLEIDTLHESWLDALHCELTKPYFISLKEFLARERATKTIFPPEKDVYAWSRHTPLASVRVVILGQDPYHNHGQAHGLCFSVQAPTPPPPSLKNIFKCLQKDIDGFSIPKHGSLLPWADRGVLMLNTCLTVEAHKPNSHQNRGWEIFTSKVIDVVNRSQATNGVVFMAWGSPAAKRCVDVNKTKHLVLHSVHPSPLSAARGFFECAHFSKANAWLAEKYGKDNVIEWNSLTADSG